MPKRCADYGCRGNYLGEPYTPVVRFPTGMTERNKWIEAMPNDPGSLREKKKSVCVHHILNGSGCLLKLENGQLELLLNVTELLNPVRSNP